jgi:hypothetical protein
MIIEHDASVRPPREVSTVVLTGAEELDMGY